MEISFTARRRDPQTASSANCPAVWLSGLLKHADMTGQCWAHGVLRMGGPNTIPGGHQTASARFKPTKQLNQEYWCGQPPVARKPDQRVHTGAFRRKAASDAVHPRTSRSGWRAGTSFIAQIQAHLLN